MESNSIGFLIWAAAALLIAGIGVHAWFSRKPAGFFAGVEIEAVTDVKRYNHRVGLLFIGYAVVFLLLGIPMLFDDVLLLLLLSVPGIMAETIAAMVIYTQAIAKKYQVRSAYRKPDPRQ